MLSKKELRQKFKGLRDSLGSATRSVSAQQMLNHLSKALKSEAFSKINEIFLYKALLSEPNLFDLVFVNKNLIYGLPKINQDSRLKQMEFYLVDEYTPFVTNRFGIDEPESSKKIEPTNRTLILTPSLAISETGVRLGYGGGYYDRYFDCYQNSIRVGVCYSQFFVKELPVGEHDIAMHYILTEAGLFKAGAFT